jgi:fatty acid desaturase
MKLKLLGTSLTEVLLFCFVLLAVISFLTWIWKSSVMQFVWLFGLTLWVFLHIKKSHFTHQRFREIDERDLDFKDECDSHRKNLYAKIEHLEKKVEELSARS